jgi:hypothetical protein
LSRRFLILGDDPTEDGAHLVSQVWKNKVAGLPDFSKHTKWGENILNDNQMDTKYTKWP